MNEILFVNSIVQTFLKNIALNYTLSIDNTLIINVRTQVFQQIKKGFDGSKD